LAKHSEVRITVSEVTISSGKKKSIRVDIDGETVNIPIDEAVYAYWQEQFVRPNPTPLQRKRFGTLMHVVRAAYKTGFDHGKDSASKK